VVASVIVGAVSTSAGAATCTTPGCLYVNSDAYVTAANHVLTVAAPGVLSNDLTPPGTTVDVTDSDTVSAFGASITWAPDHLGGFTYTPDLAAPWTGVDSFTYYAQDTNNNKDYNTVYVRVDALPKDDTYYTNVNTPLNVDTAHSVFLNDIGLEQAILGYDGITAQHGQVVMNDDGSFVYTPATGFIGVDSFTYTAWNIAEDNFFSATVRVSVTKPVTTMTQPASLVTLGTSLPVAWSATAVSGIKYYDVQVRGALYNGGFGSYSAFKSGTTTTSGTYTSSGTGRTYCFRAHAVDNVLNNGDYSAAKCTTIPIKSNGLSYTSGFKSALSSSYYGGIAYGTTGVNETMTRTGIQAKRIYLVVTTCSTCGSLQVKWGSTVVANVSLVSSTTKHKVVIGVASFSSVQSGTLTARVTSSGKPVVIEGLAAYRDA
jgi:hypothetical protein